MLHGHDSVKGKHSPDETNFFLFSFRGRRQLLWRASVLSSLLPYIVNSRGLIFLRRRNTRVLSDLLCGWSRPDETLLPFVTILLGRCLDHHVAVRVLTMTEHTAKSSLAKSQDSHVLPARINISP
jgi:hypothetical protein